MQALEIIIVLVVILALAAIVWPVPKESTQEQPDPVYEGQIERKRHWRNERHLARMEQMRTSCQVDKWLPCEPNPEQLAKQLLTADFGELEARIAAWELDRFFPPAGDTRQLYLQQSGRVALNTGRNLRQGDFVVLTPGQLDQMRVYDAHTNRFTARSSTNVVEFPKVRK